jgi:hypothetical protein
VVLVRVLQHLQDSTVLDAEAVQVQGNTNVWQNIRSSLRPWYSYECCSTCKAVQCRMQRQYNGQAEHGEFTAAVVLVQVLQHLQGSMKADAEAVRYKAAYVSGSTGGMNSASDAIILVRVLQQPQGSTYAKQYGYKAVHVWVCLAEHCTCESACSRCNAVHMQATVYRLMLPLLDSLLAWEAHSEHQEVWAGPSWSSIALKVRSLLLPGVQDPSKSVLLQVVCAQHFRAHVTENAGMHNQGQELQAGVALQELCTHEYRPLALLIARSCQHTHIRHRCAWLLL